MRALIAVLLLATPVAVRRLASQSARYSSEEEAIRKGERLGIGVARLESATEVAVDSVVDVRLRFTAGRAGIKTGGGIRIGLAHGLFANWNVEKPEIPAAPGEALWRWTSYQGVGANKVFARFHPWQNMHEFLRQGTALNSGDSVLIALPGARVQRFDESAFVFRFYVDAEGNDDWLPLRTPPFVRVRSGPAAVLRLNAPSEWEAGKPGWVQVWAGDEFGNPAHDYRGTVVFDCGGACQGLPAEFAFHAEDGSARRFENVTFASPGVYRLQVREKTGALAAESNPVVVRARALQERVWWGDIHTHTRNSDGRGTPEETYRFGRDYAALDFAAVTDHDFLVSDAMWEEIREATRRYHQPGRYVTFLAYEWSGTTDLGGDHNVYTSDPDMPLYRCYSYFNYDNLRFYRGSQPGAGHVEQLFRLLGARFRNENLMVIPHYGGRRGNPEFHDPRIQRQVEIFSDHRRSEDWASKFLEKGYRMGIMASTDNHSGNAGFGVRRNAVSNGEKGELFSQSSPAELGTALVAVYAPALTREAVFQGLYHRRTYATTGERIVLRFEVNGQPMGSEVRSEAAPTLVAQVHGTAPVAKIRLVRSGRIIHQTEPNALDARVELSDTSGAHKGAYYYVDVVQADGNKAISSPVWVD